MSFLLRCINQAIHIHTSDGVIEIHLNDCNDNHASLGLVAPQSAAMLCAEIDDAKTKNAATGGSLVKLQRKAILSLLRELFACESADSTETRLNDLSNPVLGHRHQRSACARLNVRGIQS